MVKLMGSCVGKRGSGRDVTLAILGLDNAGKTVTTKGLQGASLDGVAPTIGFSSVEFRFDKFNVTLFDLGGGKRIRDIWKQYFTEIYGLIYVIDASEPERIEECSTTLQQLLAHERVSGKPVLVLANKQDKVGALDERDIVDQMRLEDIVNMHKCPARLEMCSAINGQGKKLDKAIKLGVSWLLKCVHADWEDLHNRVSQDLELQKETAANEKRERQERVRKIREERQAKERAERRARGEASEEEDDVDTGNPFKVMDADEIQKMEAKAKEEKRRSRQRSSHDSDEDQSRKPRLSQRSKQDSDDDVPYQKSLRTSPYNRSLTRSASDENLHKDTSRFSDFNQRRLSNKSDSPVAEAQNGLYSASSLTAAQPWHKTTPRPMDLSPRHDSVESQNKKHGSLAPLRPLAPLDSLSADAKKKKKKKAKKNQTVPSLGDEDDTNRSFTSSHLYSGSSNSLTRGSRASRLDTVQEPDSEGDHYGGGSRFTQKWGLMDDLPELNTRGGSKRFQSNSDLYDSDIVT